MDHKGIVCFKEEIEVTAVIKGEIASTKEYQINKNIILIESVYSGEKTLKEILKEHLEVNDWKLQPKFTEQPYI